MCGRYSLFTEQENKEIRKIIQMVNNKYKEKEMMTGEIFPTNTVPVLIEIAGKTVPVPMKWGFTELRRSGVIINARAETAREKPMFREAILYRRCVIPSTGFYEWDKKKQKYQFNLVNEQTLYMAGLWKEYDGEGRFVILTTAPNASMKDVHDRMPLILQRSQVKPWLCDFNTAERCLHETPPELVRKKV